ncbi:hypothetical protein VDIAB_230056 [Vibrio diabolicus]|nr:hypothetical protein VDIAB_230056 [Vibrio diabolicus]
MISLVIYGITILAIIATAIFSIWTYVDTNRKYSMEDFTESRKIKNLEAENRFKDKTRLGK